MNYLDTEHFRREWLKVRAEYRDTYGEDPTHLQTAALLKKSIRTYNRWYQKMRKEDEWVEHLRLRLEVTSALAVAKSAS